MELYVYHLEKSPLKEDIELRLGVRFERVLEKAFYAKVDGKYLFFTMFGCFAFLGFTKDEMLKAIQQMFKNKGEEVVAQNIKAFEAGYNFK